MIDTSLQSPSKAPFLNLKFETDYFLLGLCGGIILVASLIIPFVSLGYDLIRVYEQMAVFLSVFLVTGGILLSKYIKISAHAIILIVLIPYFLFTTFAAYEVFGIHRTFILDAKSPDAAYEVVNMQESISAKWLKQYMDGVSAIHAPDYYAANKLLSQGLISENYIDSKSFYNHGDTRGYIYLDTNNLVNQTIMFGQTSKDMSQYQDILNVRNKIYSNGGSAVYK